jgi:nicotinamide phosphoribosyltransferase
MCSNYAIDGDEETFLNKLFTEIYPGGALSVVMDSYDYWANLQRCGVGKLREAVMGRAGTVFFRGDSGDPVDIICGYKPQLFATFEDMKSSRAVKGEYVYIKDEQRYYTFSKSENRWITLDTVPVEVKGTVELLWDMFGGTVNKAGYKVLDSHVRAIYGDSITPNRADAMYKRLAEKGFASCNVALGAGSFSTQCAEDKNGELYPFTRDSYGIAVKATWCENKNTEKEYQLFKNPKTDTGKFKKSQKGLIYVTLDENGEIIAKDGYTSETLPKEGNLLQPIFRNGEMLHEETLSEIRNRLH